jgi:hypothetical protein
MDNSNASNEEVFAVLCKAFYDALEEHLQKKQKQVNIKSMVEYDELINFLKGPGPKDKNIKKTKPEYYIIQNNVIMKGDAMSGQRDYLVSKNKLKMKETFMEM